MQKLGKSVVILFTKLAGHSLAVAIISSALASLIAELFSWNIYKFLNLELTNEFIITIASLGLFLTILNAFMYGIAHRIGVPAALRTYRIVNEHVHADKDIYVNDDLQPEQYKEVLKALDRMPLVTFLLAVKDIVLLAGFCLTWGIMTGNEGLVRWIGVFAAVIFISFACLSYFLVEWGTGWARVDCKRHLRRLGAPFQEKARHSILLKVGLIVGLLMAGIFVSNILTYLNRERIGEVLIFSSLVVLAAVIMAVFVIQMLHRSFREVDEAISELKSGGEGIVFSHALDKEFVNLSQGINVAADTINDYRANLEEKVEQRTQEIKEYADQLEAKDQKLAKELDFAADIQQGIITNNLSAWNAISFSATYIPMGKVSGDYYDIFRFKDCIFILIVDVSGHGVPAAFITMTAKEAFARAVQPDREPADIFRSVNEEICRRVHTQDYMTAFLVKVDASNRVVYANAGHQKPLVLRAADNSVDELDTGGMIIGALAEAGSTFEQKELTLQSGDRFYMFTDGIVEQKNAAEEAIDPAYLPEMLKSELELELAAVHEKVMNRVDSFRGDVEYQDDITIFSFQVSPHWAQFARLYNDGSREVKSGNFSKAAELLLEAESLVTTYPRLYLQLARAHYELGDHSKAEEFIEECTKVFKKDFSALSLAVQICNRSGNEKRADWFMSRLKHLYPNEPRLRQLEAQLSV